MGKLYKVFSHNFVCNFVTGTSLVRSSFLALHTRLPCVSQEPIVQVMKSIELLIRSKISPLMHTSDEESAEREGVLKSIFAGEIPLNCHCK